MSFEDRFHEHLQAAVAVEEHTVTTEKNNFHARISNPVKDQRPPRPMYKIVYNNDYNFRGAYEVYWSAQSEEPKLLEVRKKESDSENDFECYNQTDEKQMKLNIEYELKTNKSKEELALLPENLKQWKETT